MQYTPHPRAQIPAATAKLGKAAPDFTLTDSGGKTVKLSKLRGKTVVLEWFNPDCPFIKYAHSKGPLKDFAKRVSNAQVGVVVETGLVGHTYGAEKTPPSTSSTKTAYWFTAAVWTTRR